MQLTKVCGTKLSHNHLPENKNSKLINILYPSILNVRLTSSGSFVLTTPMIVVSDVRFADISPPSIDS